MRIAPTVRSGRHVCGRRLRVDGEQHHRQLQRVGFRCNALRLRVGACAVRVPVCQAGRCWRSLSVYVCASHPQVAAGGMFVGGGSVSMEGSTIVSCSGSASNVMRSARAWERARCASQCARPVGAGGPLSVCVCVSRPQYAAGGMYVDGGSVSMVGSTIVNCSGSASNDVRSPPAFCLCALPSRRPSTPSHALSPLVRSSPAPF